MHFAVPMAGAVLNTINTRLSAKDISTILSHCEPKALFVDYEYIPLACDALRLLRADNQTKTALPSLVIIGEIGSNKNHGFKQGELRYEHLALTTNYRNAVLESTLPLVDVDPPSMKLNNPRHVEYEELVAMGHTNFEPLMVRDEWDPITLNYTSGTTSAPKGVVYSHRGAYLSTLSLILGWEMRTEPVYLWTLPMFHCNGWTFTWGVAARGGTNVCIRNTTAAEIYRSIALHGVTHMCAAPTVFKILQEAKHEERVRLEHPVQILTGGAPPPAALLEEMAKLGFHVVHAYGLTEATGPALVCEWQKRWDGLTQEKQAQLKARQGISVLTVADAAVIDLKTLCRVPQDGKTVGEIVLRGSGIMKGYFKDENATSEAFKHGWFHTGDLGVVHPDGYIEIKDRLKDVIISGGENISSVEVEGAIFRHPKVSEAAVVAMPHPRWGETPCAFVVPKKEANGKVTVQEIIAHCRSSLSHYMVPRKVVFVDEIPKTGTGKPEKKLLRERAKKFGNVPQSQQELVMSRL